MSRKEERINKLKTFLGLFNHLSWDGIKVAFIVSTGRTGTMFLENFYNRISSHVYARHEPNPDFLKLGIHYARGAVSEEKAKQEIFRGRLWVLDQIRRQGKTAYVECNNNLFSLVPLLWEIWPEARVVHIVRDGRDFVRSVMCRNHYTSLDKIHAKKNLRLLASDFPGDPLKDRWQTLSPFQKCCWEWRAKDNIIRQAVEGDARAMTVKYEDLFDAASGYESLTRMTEFMDIGIDKESARRFALSFATNHYNRNKSYSFPAWPEWKDENLKQFLEIAGDHMRQYGYQ